MAKAKKVNIEVTYCPDCLQKQTHTPESDIYGQNLKPTRLEHTLVLHSSWIRGEVFVIDKHSSLSHYEDFKHISVVGTLHLLTQLLAKQ